MNESWVRWWRLRGDRYRAPGKSWGTVVSGFVRVRTVLLECFITQVGTLPIRKVSGLVVMVGGGGLQVVDGDGGWGCHGGGGGWR